MSQVNETVCRLRLPSEDGNKFFTIHKTPFVIGRALDSDLVLQNDSISRKHTRITYEEGDWVLRDLGSKNGSRVNTFRVEEHEEQLLQPGDRIDLGTVRFYVEIGPAELASRARVIFDDDKAPALHTEVLDLPERLDRLLQAGGEFSVRAPRFEDHSVLSGLGEERSVAVEGPGEMLQLVTDSAESLLSCTTLPETLERILSLVFTNLPAERGVICLYDPDSQSIEPMAMRNREGVPDEPIEISTNITGAAIKGKQAVLSKYTAMDERFEGAESIIMMDIQSAMCSPLLREGKVSGYIYVDRQSSTHTFEMPQLHALSILALLASIAVEQAGLRDDVRREQERRNRLARYSSPAVVERILEAPDQGKTAMSAEEGDVSVLFADLTGFTNMAERLPASEVVLILNRVFERLTSAVFELDGTLDKFRGDGMMAFFGAPLAMPDHAARAVEAALRMQEALADLNASREGVRPIQMRIGVNSGTVVVGDIGSPQRKDYTVIGDVVNVASRLESSVAKPGEIIIGESTYESAKESFHCEPLEEVRLKGKQESVRPFLVVGRIDKEVHLPSTL